MAHCLQRSQAGARMAQAVLKAFGRIDLSWIRIEIALLVGAAIMAA